VVRGILELLTALRGTIVVAARRVGARKLSIATAGLMVTCLAVGGAVLGVDAWLGDDPDVGSLWPEQVDGGSGSGSPPADEAAAAGSMGAVPEDDPATAAGDRSREVGRAASATAADVEVVAEGLAASGAADAAGEAQPVPASPGGTTPSPATTGGDGGAGGTPGTTAPTPTTGAPTTTTPPTTSPPDGGPLSGLLELLGLG
jgi:hypothetical protein